MSDSSEENYHRFYHNINRKLNKEDEFKKVTRVRILDKFLEENLITDEFHKKMLKQAILLDKKDDNYDMLSSLLVSASTLLFFLIVFIPEKESFTRMLFSVYIFCIYLVAYMFYK
tara:strand:- start:124 stop:468 length:345 start_codon:yes stop_codon:yes gene_type:complete